MNDKFRIDEITKHLWIWETGTRWENATEKDKIFYRERAKEINKLYSLEGVEKYQKCSAYGCQDGKFVFGLNDPETCKECHGTGEIKEDILFEELEPDSIRGVLKPHLKDWKVRATK